MNRLAVWTLIASLPSSDSPEVAYRAIGDVATVMERFFGSMWTDLIPSVSPKQPLMACSQNSTTWSRRVRAQEVIAADQDDAIDWSCSNDGDILKLRIHRF